MKSSLSCKENIRRKCYIPGAMFGPFSFINVLSGKVVFDAENGMKNMVEVAVATRIVQLLYKECVSSKHKISIAVLSPYHAQVECLQQKLENHCNQNNEFFKVKVGSVLGYQGKEVDVVIISTVGANGDACFEEVNRSPKTWARHCLWVIGDERMHIKGGSVWESLMLEAKAGECFFQADEQKDLAKIIVDVKKDLHQLDELLSGETTLFRNTTWKVLFSNMFRTSFSKIESQETKKLVLLMLLKLSTGWRPKRTSTAASVSESSYSELIKEFKVKGLHIIGTIDLAKETQYTQVLKVWDILPFNDIANLVTRLDGIIGMYTREYIDYCKARCVQRGSEFPLQWPVRTKILQYKTHGECCDEMFMVGENENSYVENVKVRESLILMKFYSLSTGAVNNMISGCKGGDLGLEFELTEQEKDVVSFDKSSFILGRSGTGKTTVLTMKLFQHEQLHHLACEGFHEVMERNEEAKQDVLHQLFVTFSPKLCYAVKQHFGEWKRLTCGGSLSSKNSTEWIGDIDKMMLSEDIPDHFINLPHNAYPLIITFHRFLLMLDGTMGTSYFNKFPGVRKLILGSQTTNSRLIVLEQFMRFKDVTFERFCSIYWPHLNNKLTKNLDPSSVYTEIMSVIKGGILTSRKAANEILSRDDYVSLCDGRVSIFAAEKREIIYDIFLQYEMKKVENGNFDLADLVNDLHQRLEVEGYKGDVMDYVYIDEVQDLSMRQILLFKYVCKNVHEGFAFSGDTAQAIAKGIGFRFEDIRCLFFRKFLLGSEKGKMSKMLHLSENFRTHAGVLNLAQSVIDLLGHFFPLFVDALGAETSQVGGELPILIETDINYNAIKTIFGMDGDCCRQVTGFGAEQVVLVRDESLKEKVINIVGKNALVLTIMESKGLEFQDVLLYDFFTTSSFSNEWRIIYEYMKEKDLLKSPSTEMCPCFDMEKHTVLCSELKQLYVAITRTRQRLWVCESSGFSQPIYDYWKMLSLVEVKPLSDLLADKMHIPSSKDEWKSRGIKLFHENNFSMAHMCFLKAGDTQSEILAKAYELRAIANRTQASHHKKKLFEDAVKLFISIDKEELAAECFYEMEDYTTAGDIYLRVSMLEKAGNCFYLAKCYKQAVDIYEKAGAFSKCLSACADGKLFEIGFEILGRMGGCGNMEQEFLQKGALYYLSVKDLKSMMKFVRSFRSKDYMWSFLTKRRCFDELILLAKEWGNYEEASKVAHEGASYYISVNNYKGMMKFVRSFHSKGEMRSFLTENGCLDELILLEKEWGNFKEAANVARRKQDPVLEADLLCLGGCHRESSFIILWHVFLNSPIFRSAEEPFTQKDRLLRKAVLIAKSNSNVFHQFVCKEAKILSEGITEVELLKKGLEFIYCYKENPLVANLRRVKTTHEIEKIENYVIDKVYSMFKPANRLDELLLLQEAHGMFVEASKIGNENDHSIDAALRRLWYVFFGSLWAHGKGAWPLKDFKQKDKLLCDANSYVKYHPVSQNSAMVRAEINVLSGAEISLSQLWRYLRDMPRERSLRLHFLISRRILDVHLQSCYSDYACIETWSEDGTIKHLEGSLLNENVSAEGLIYFWSYWKGLICELLNWSNKQHSDCKVYKDFIFNYFGVRKYDGDKKGSYVVLNSESQWVKQFNPSMIKNDYLYIIRAPALSSVVSQYWCSELLSVAVKVLQKLKSFYSYSTVKKFSAHQQTSILTGLFEVAKSLQNCKFPYRKINASLIVDQYSRPYVDLFLSNVFHINWKYAQSKEMIYLRGKEAFQNILKEAININSKLHKGLTCGNLGRMAMIFLGSNVIGFNNDTKKKVAGVSSMNWRDLLSKLNGGRSSLKRGDLAISLHNVLKETFIEGWRVMSPSYLLYLMERLLILSFCDCGYVFTTRSSSVEWLTYEEWNMGSNGGCATFLDTMKNFRHSLASMVGEILNSQDALMQWVTRSEKEFSYIIVVLRLFVLLSLICANSGRYYYHLLDLLERSHFVSLLPPAFRETLIKGIKEDRLVDAVAAACEQIDNPLVVVSFNEDFPKAPCQNAIFLNMKKLDFGRETLIEMLYREKCEAASTSCCDREK